MRRCLIGFSLSLGQSIRRTRIRLSSLSAFAEKTSDGALLTTVRKIEFKLLHLGTRSKVLSFPATVELPASKHREVHDSHPAYAALELNVTGLHTGPSPLVL